MRESNIGLHTMINEHFGIGVVECMASGLITIAHDSAGPKLDIIAHDVDGFLANDKESFVDILIKVINLCDQELNTFRQKARESVERFSEKRFEINFINSIKSIFN